MIAKSGIWSLHYFFFYIRLTDSVDLSKYDDYSKYY